MEKNVKALAENSLKIALKSLEDFELNNDASEAKIKPKWSKIFRGIAKIFDGIADILEGLGE